jgi:hypothetical protein
MISSHKSKIKWTILHRQLGPFANAHNGDHLIHPILFQMLYFITLTTNPLIKLILH